MTCFGETYGYRGKGASEAFIGPRSLREDIEALEALTAYVGLTSQRT